MIVVGCCVGPGGRFEAIAGPALDATLQPGDDLVLIRNAKGICRAYNEVLERARAVPDCEGVLLVHDDVELGGPRARAALVAAAMDTGVGLVGVAGGRGLVWGKWWSGRTVAGRINDSRGDREIGPVDADVDAVDGCLLFVTPAAMHLSFDEERFPAFHGYDVDFSLRVRDSDLRVVTRRLDYRHRDKGNAGDVAAFEHAMRVLELKWSAWIRPRTTWERMGSIVRRLASGET